MGLLEHPKTFDDAISFSRSDELHCLSTFSPHSFVLEERQWLSAEHYYQTSKFAGRDYAEKVAVATDAAAAHRLGNVWFKRKRADFKLVRRVLMTRALFSKAQQNPDVAEFLLDTGDHLLIETSAYDHFWGLGRDQRGQNQLGKIWMDVRRKLREAKMAAASTSA